MRIAYTKSAFWRGLVIATTIAGTLELLGAFLFDILSGGSPVDLLNGISSAVWPQLDMGDVANAASGLLFHFFITLAMVAVYFAVAALVPRLNRDPRWSGVGYGLLLWIVMYWIVLPHRFPTMFPVFDLRQVGEQLFSHVALVGLPIAYVARIATRWRTPEW